jgi:hypothetical protein
MVSNDHSSTAKKLKQRSSPLRSRHDDTRTGGGPESSLTGMQAQFDVERLLHATGIVDYNPLEGQVDEETPCSSFQGHIAF